MDVAVACSRVTRRFGHVFALRNVTFEATTGTVFGVLGANGAGKTTLLEVLAGLQKPTSGTVRILGKTREEDHLGVKGRVALLSARTAPYDDLTVGENLHFFARLHRIFDDRRRNIVVDFWARRFGLDPWIDDPVRILSAGWKRKVELARCMLHSPRVLMLDEPFAGLDFGSRKALVEELRRLATEDGVTSLLATHELDLAAQACHEAIVLRRGAVARFLTDSELRTGNLGELL